MGWPWQRRPAPDQRVPEQADDEAQQRADDPEVGPVADALDALAGVLRKLGEHGFDLEAETRDQFAQACQVWARHVLTCTPPPLPEAAATAGGVRAWTQLQQFVGERRRAEQRYVASLLTEFREATWTFVQTIQTDLSRDRDSDERITAEIQAIQRLDSASPEEFRREVLGRVTTLALLVQERRQRQQERLTALSLQVSELSRQLQQTKLDSTIDHLTQLYNRSALEECLGRMKFLREAFGQSACLLMIDLDRFKELNDRLGHPVGDQALRGLADRLARGFPRKSDFVARYGGDEFAVVLPETPQAQAERLAERCLRTIREQPLSVQDQQIRLTVSIGLAELGRGESAETWLARADQALYQAKQAGRDRLSIAVEESAPSQAA